MDPGLPSSSALRGRMADARLKNMLTTAAFFGEKLLCCPGAGDADVFALAQVYQQQGQPKRALLAIARAGNSKTPNAFRLLAGQCLAETKEYDRCLELLGETDQPSEGWDEGTIDTAAAICLLRGKVYDMQQNRAKAAEWYQEAVARDPRCYEAFERLVDGHMLSAGEQAKLMKRMKFAPQDLWMHALYQSRINQYDFSVENPMEVPAAPGVLEKSLDGMTALAEVHYARSDFQRCLAQTSAVLEQDPFAHGCLPAHLSALVELGKVRELFIEAHRLVEAFPQSAKSWYAVGCYYFLTRKFELARRFFLKSTSLDEYFAPAWLGYGHTFAEQDESDQALAAYRTAARFFSGSHLPPLCIGMEYAKTGNLQVADQFFTHTISVCSRDPLVYNEIGALRFLQQDFHEAARAFTRVLELGVKDDFSVTWEPTLFNLGHCYRKMQRFDDAIDAYSKAMRRSPRNASTYTALGFTHHLKGDLDMAVTLYHKALGLAEDDALTAEMLQRALRDACEQSPL